jgi:hypothetical protein
MFNQASVFENTQMFRDGRSTDGQSARNIPNRHRCFFQQRQDISASLVPQCVHHSLNIRFFSNHRVTVTRKLPRYQVGDHPGFFTILGLRLLRLVGYNNRRAYAGD